MTIKTNQNTPDMTEAWGALLRAQRVAMENVEADLKRNSLPPLIWYDVLLELQRAPENMLRHNVLNEKMLLPKHNLSRLIDRMEKQDLVSRAACNIDKRGSFVCITDKGKQLQKRMWPTYEVAIKQYFADRFSPEEAKVLADFLGRI